MKLVDKIASFFEKPENWSALKNCMLINYKSEDLRALLCKALDEDDSVQDTKDDWILKGNAEIKETEYERGANDAWELARKICLHEEDGGMSMSDVRMCFGESHFLDIFDTHTYEQAAEKFRAWKENKDKLKPGDVVELFDLYGCKIKKGILVYADDELFSLLGISYRDLNISRLMVVNYRRGFNKIVKTGEHFDIKPLLDVLKED